MRRLIILLCALVATSPLSAEDQYDIVLSNGRVMDPETGLDAVRNVGIRGQTIVAITSDPIQGETEVNARGLVVDSGPFVELIDAEVESDWGNYKVTLRRGSGYPATTAEWDARVVETEADRLRDTLVREGQDIWIQLRDAQDEVLVQESESLRPLVTESDGEVEVMLPGRITASRVVFSVNKHEKKE